MREFRERSPWFSLYEEMVRVPLMIYAPGLLPAGKRIDTPVRSLDIFPTLCDLLDIEAPDGLEGRSLLPLIKDGEAPSTPAIFSEHIEVPKLREIGYSGGTMTSVRTGRWKFILNETGSQLLEKPKRELYDLTADPGETANVAEAHPDVVARLEAKVIAFIAAHRGAEAAPTTDSLDPEVAEQLEALGYLGGGE